MGNRLKRVQIKFAAFGVIGLAFLALVVFLIIPQYTGGVISAYLLSFLFVGANFIGIKDFERKSNTAFYRRFLITMSIRFVFVIAVIVILLETTKFHQIYFTVSFIISYILHSVIEIISINQLLKTDN
ncbi:MAG TPA: hypothetical protein VF181_08335 [Balneolaceae bacterium]